MSGMHEMNASTNVLRGYNVTSKVIKKLINLSINYPYFSQFTN